MEVKTAIVFVVCQKSLRGVLVWLLVIQPPPYPPTSFRKMGEAVGVRGYTVLCLVDRAFEASLTVCYIPGIMTTPARFHCFLCFDALPPKVAKIGGTRELKTKKVGQAHSRFIKMNRSSGPKSHDRVAVHASCCWKWKDRDGMLFSAGSGLFVNSVALCCKQAFQMQLEASVRCLQSYCSELKVTAAAVRGHSGLVWTDVSKWCSVMVPMVRVWKFEESDLLFWKPCQWKINDSSEASECLWVLTSHVRLKVNNFGTENNKLDSFIL